LKIPLNCGRFWVTSHLFYVFYPPTYPQVVDKVVNKAGEHLIVSAYENTQSDNIRALSNLSTDFVDYLWVIPQLMHK